MMLLVVAYIFVCNAYSAIPYDWLDVVITACDLDYGIGVFFFFGLVLWTRDNAFCCKELYSVLVA